MADPRTGRLVIVGTPIGNLEDISPRAVRTLGEADAIFCEDTRVTAKLAFRFGWKAPRVSCPEPRERARVPELLARLQAGETVAFVSDAGMPLMSDPGRELVAAAAASGFTVEVVPGPSAVSAALALSALPAVPHFFAGFLPARESERRRYLAALAGRTETLVWFEAPHRLLRSLDDAISALGARRACVARELTKMHEEAVRGTLPEIASVFRARKQIKGEVTVVVEGADSVLPRAGDDSGKSLDQQIRAGLVSGRSKREVAREIALRSGRSAREIYARAVALGSEEGDPQS